jgi:hypothetical protein
VRLAGCAKNVVFAPGDRICVEGTHASGSSCARKARERRHLRPAPGRRCWRRATPAT